MALCPMHPEAVLAKTLWGAGPPSAEWGGAIINSRWKNWGAWTKSEGAKAPPSLEPPLHASLSRKWS